MSLSGKPDIVRMKHKIAILHRSCYDSTIV